MANLVLEFRRHLAICVIVLLANEIGRKNSGFLQQGQHRVVRYASATADFNNQRYSPSAARLQLQDADSSLQQHQSSDGRPMNDDDDDSDFITRALDFIGSYLPTIDLNYTLFDKEFTNQQLDIEVENYYRENFQSNLTLDELQLLSIKASLRLAPMPIHMSWGYESRDELKLGSLPVQDDSRCSAHLAQLTSRLDRLTSGNPNSQAAAASSSTTAEVPTSSLIRSAVAAQFESTPVENFEAAQLYRSNDLKFLRYLDTFGKVSSDSLRGNMRWYGSYSGCLNTKLPAQQQLGGTRRIKFRYCMAALKSVSWSLSSSTDRSNKHKLKQLEGAKKWSLHNTYGIHTKDHFLENYFIRIGACLPESCDSSALDYQENWHNIEKLLKFNLMKPYNSEHYYLSDLYCPPDRRSPLRTIPLMGKLLLLATLAWLSLIGLATIVHLNVEKFYTKSVKEIRRKQQQQQQVICVDSDSTGSGGVDRLMASAQSNNHHLKSSSSSSNNELHESDFLNLRHYWIKLNVYIWDLSKKSIKGVDLIACLSLYSNWLKYTSKLKLAIVELNAEQERRERINKRNLKLVDELRVVGEGKGRKKNVPTIENNNHGNNTIDLDNSDNDQKNDQLFNTELNKRIQAQDDSDELDSDNIKKRVDTSSLNALKVIALVWIIAGHCIFYLGSSISNGAILMEYMRDLAAFALANGALYITELFFVITGCLTTYLAFKYNTYGVCAQKDAGLELVEQGEEISGGGNNKQQTSASSLSNKHQFQNNQKKLLPVEDSTTDDQKQQPTVYYLESRVFKLPFWFMIIVNRYLRIVPTYLVVYCFVRLISIYIGGSGQLWDYGVSANSMRRECLQESWLPVLTLTTNFINIYGHCIVGGWYLSADFQFMILAVPLLIVLAYLQLGGGRSLDNKRSGGNDKRLDQSFNAFTKHQLTINDESNRQQTNRNEIYITKKLALAYSIVLCSGLLSGLAAIIYGFIHSEVDFSYILKFVPHTIALLSRNVAMYTNSLLRFRAFAMGLLLGHLLYMYEFKLIKLPRLIQQHGSKLTVIIFLIGFSAMFLPVLYPQGKLIMSHDFVNIAMILTATGVDIFLSILIFLICIGKAPKMVLFLLNSPFWTVLSSLSLCAFLIHSEIIILLTSQLNPPPAVSYNLLLLIFSATLIITYLLALGLYLAFEMPISRLIEALMRKYFTSSKVVRSDNPITST